MHGQRLRNGLKAMLLAAAIGWITAPAARAELLSFDAVISSRVQEFIDGEPVSFDEAFEDFQLTTDELPLQVVSQLVFPTNFPTEVAASLAIADFREPNVNADTNPAELGVEVDAFSVVFDVGYEAVTSVAETRTIRFTQAEIGSTPDQERDVESSAFLSGGIILWSQDPDADLTGLSGEMEFVISSMRGGAEQELLRAGASVTGGAGGALDPATSLSVTDSPFAEPRVLQFVFGDVQTVRDLVGDQTALTDYEGAVGSLRAMLIPEQRIFYRYTANAEETFELLATLEVRVANLPNGTGVAAVFGRDFEDLARRINGAFEGVDGGAAQDTFNLARLEAGASIENQASSTAGGSNQRQSAGGLCGSMGFEAVGMMGLMLFAVPFVSRRQYRPPSAD